VIHERAFAKVNLILHVGAPRADGMHPLCSLLASIELADQVTLEPADRDEVVCPPVAGVNLAARALAAFREVVPDGLPAVSVRIEKHIPVAAGLAGGSADAAAVLRAANELAGQPLDLDGLRALGTSLGADVPAQVEPRHALLTGVGERVEPARLPPFALVLVPASEGLDTGAVYAELDRLRAWRDRLDPARVRGLASSTNLHRLAGAVENDLERATLSLRPQLEGTLEALRAAGALSAAITGSGPTAFGVFEDDDSAHRAAAGIEGAIATRTRKTE
jgi:4-diphosphocytidyl-2-C-methyl-D-erythritol kinase